MIRTSDQQRLGRIPQRLVREVHELCQHDGACMVKGGGIGDFGSLEQPKQWAGLFLGVPSFPEPLGAT